MADQQAIQRGAKALYEHITRDMEDGASGPDAPIWREHARVVLDAAELPPDELVERAREAIVQGKQAFDELSTLVGPLRAQVNSGEARDG